MPSRFRGQQGGQHPHQTGRTCADSTLLWPMSKAVSTQSRSRQQGRAAHSAGVEPGRAGVTSLWRLSGCGWVGPELRIFLPTCSCPMFPLFKSASQSIVVECSSTSRQARGDNRGAPWTHSDDWTPAWTRPIIRLVMVACSAKQAEPS